MKRKKSRFKAVLLKYSIVLLILLAVFKTGNHIFKNSVEESVPKRYTESQRNTIIESEYIISKEMVLSQLQTKSELVSYEQDIYRIEEHHDENFLGKRVTELTMKGSYKMGLDTEDIKVLHVDSNSGTIYIELPKPKVIALNIPYDQIKFSKEQGWLRLNMSEDEKKKFYRSAVDDIEKELNTDEDILRIANLHNQEVVRNLVEKVIGVDRIIFREN